ncbi:MAG: methylase involved in ubiquinone/menaquinone biosynthesis [Fibrobacteres bacterium]|nr:methylase involved in ubiquinone/menaquinone biosynthesis [Fibrobacterota bacterium]
MADHLDWGRESDPAALRGLLRCPVCKEPLRLGSESAVCTASACGASFPVARGIPILINEKASLFSPAGILAQDDGGPGPSKPRFWRKWESRIVPSISKNWMAERNYRRFFEALRAKGGVPMILIIGGSTVGEGLGRYLRDPAFRFVESDIYFGPRTGLISDAHDIPFADNAFDGVIIQAVIEYMVDPERGVREIHRILKTGGMVYSETPFMAQVHGGRYDFNRYSHLGHRRLFRGFTETASGPVNGPGMVLAWSWKYFLMTFFAGKRARSLAHLFAHFTAFWLKYLDGYLITKPGAFDSALGYFFMGEKSASVLPDRELIEGYRGLWELR